MDRQSIRTYSKCRPKSFVQHEKVIDHTIFEDEDGGSEELLVKGIFYVCSILVDFERRPISALPMCSSTVDIFPHNSRMMGFSVFQGNHFKFLDPLAT